MLIQSLLLYNLNTLIHIFTLPTTAETFFNGQFHYLYENGIRSTVLANSDFDCDFIERNNLIALTVPIARSITPIADLKAIIKIAITIRKNKYDAVIGHTPKGAMVAMFAAKLAGVKTRIYYRHGLIYTTAKGLKRFILKTVEQATAACATAIVNVSPSLNKLAVKDHLNSNRKQYVIGCGTCGGIDTIDTFNPVNVSSDTVSALRNSLGIPDGAFVVGFCGSLCRDKGIVELIEGFKLFYEAHPEIETRLLLVGSYDARDILPQDIKDEIENNLLIIAPGSISQHYLPNYYSLMDVFVFPSYREGFGMTVIEASAMRLPILVSRSHGCIDSIREDVTGGYIYLTPQSIASSLAKMLNPELRQHLGNAGRDFVTKNFERSSMWPKILAFYKEILRHKI